MGLPQVSRDAGTSLRMLMSTSFQSEPLARDLMQISKRISNPRSMPFKGSKLQNPGPLFQIETLRNGRRAPARARALMASHAKNPIRTIKHPGPRNSATSPFPREIDPFERGNRLGSNPQTSRASRNGRTPPEVEPGSSYSPLEV